MPRQVEAFLYEPIKAQRLIEPHLIDKIWAIL